MAFQRLLFCLLFAYLAYQSFAQLELYGSKVGEHCERDYHCIKNAFCRAQQTCLCEPNHTPSPDFSLCIATVGLICANDTTCALMSNAECRQNVCACKETYTVDVTNSSNCISRPFRESDPCQRNDDCIDAMDRALCINDHCKCLTDHHFSNVTTTCVRTRNLFNVCENDYECYDVVEPDLLECKDGTCKCKAGKSSSRCSGAINISATTITVFFFLLAIIVT